MRVIHTIRDIPSNPKGLCALSIDNEKSYLAYPGSSQVGEVQIFDTMNLVREILFLNKQFIGFEMALRKFLKS